MRHIVMLAGGQGKRFWPKSRRARPKQFMSFDGGVSLLRATSERLAPVVPYDNHWVVTHRAYATQARVELPELPAAQVVGEPRAVNTAAAVGIAAALLIQKDPEAVMMIQAADHWIRDVRRFQQLVAGGFAEVERRGGALLIGFKPNRPAVGYGYIEAGERVRGGRGLRLSRVRSYKEKPTAATARRYLASGRYLWNGCQFFWHARTILDEIRRSLPALGSALEKTVTRLGEGMPLDQALARLYRRLESVSIEHGVVERMPDKLVLEGDCGWEDVGTWGALAHLFPADADGNVSRGRHLALDTRRSLVLADEGLVVTLGVSDLIVVRDGNAILIAPRAREGDLRLVVDELERRPKLREYL